MHYQVILSDSRMERSESIRVLFEKRGLKVQQIGHLSDAVNIVEADSRYYILLTHCDFLNDSFTSLARLRQNPRVKILLFSTNEKEKLRSAPLIPHEVDLLVERIRSFGSQIA